MSEGYLRPIIFLGEGAMGIYAPNNPVRATVICWKWGAYLGEEALKKGIRARSPRSPATTSTSASRRPR